MVQKSVLGKGLASLLPGAPQFNPSAVTPPALPQVEIANKDRIPGVAFVLLDEIVPNPYQPRREFDAKELEDLAQSIRTNGIIQPLVVRKGTYGYQLIAGERRFRASKIAGLKQVPVVVRKSTDREALELALVENIQRENLNCVDEALAYQQLISDFNLTQEEAAERVGKDRATVANFLRILKHPSEIIEALKSGELSFGHGKALLAVDELEKRVFLKNKAIEEKLSVRALEALILESSLTSAQPVQASAVKTESDEIIRARFKALEQEFTKTYGFRVEQKGTESRGKFVIHYRSREELDRLIENMRN